MAVITFKEYFDALLEGKLVGLKCQDCSAITCPPKNTCNECGSYNLEKTTLSGRGVIMTFTSTYIPPSGYEKEAPFVIGMVKLEEGPWIIGRIDIAPGKADELSEKLIGREVEVSGKEFPSEQFYPDKDRRVVPIFKMIDK